MKMQLIIRNDSNEKRMIWLDSKSILIFVVSVFLYLLVSDILDNDSSESWLHLERWLI